MIMKYAPRTPLNLFNLKRQMITPYYFAYGSNLDVEQMSLRCPNARILGQMTLKGYQLAFKGVADIEPVEGAKVVGGLFKITASDEVLLDRYEGYPSLYIKKYIKSKKYKRVMFYQMNETHRRNLYALPNRSYFETILQGYDDFGIETELLLDALDYTTVSLKDQRVELEQAHTLHSLNGLGKTNEQQIKKSPK